MSHKILTNLDSSFKGLHWKINNDIKKVITVNFMFREKVGRERNGLMGAEKYLNIDKIIFSHQM